jgi:disulfide bond formation protein DsbB
MKALLTMRRINLFAFVICCLLLLSVLYFEYYKGLEPCLLCNIQRIEVGLLAIIFLVAALHHHKQWLYQNLALLVAALGILTAGRQVWLQLYPPQASDVCLPGLSYMLANLPLMQTIQMISSGSDNCSQITWTFLQLSMASWSLLFFILFACLAIIQMLRR